MSIFIYNKQKNPRSPKMSLCEPCRVNELVAAATTMVQGEPWCDECMDYHAAMCGECCAMVAADDCEPDADGEWICYDCRQK
jgi:hypothetical protein